MAKAPVRGPEHQLRGTIFALSTLISWDFQVELVA
jgi:hypothetical protein